MAANLEAIRNNVGTEVDLGKEINDAQAMQIAEALAHVHARGVLHQDVKPANVLISGLLACRRGDDVTTRVIVKLTDFGLSRRGVGPGRKGELQAPLGGMTPAFQSPEIAAHIRRCATEPSEKPLLLSPSSHDLWAWALTANASTSIGRVNSSVTV